MLMAMFCGYVQESNQRRSSINKDVLENFAKFTGKHLRPSLFF